MQAPSVVLPPSGSARWDELAVWWLCRYKASTQRTYAVYLPRWADWCAAHGLDPLTARRADVELWLHAIADSGLSRASVAAHYDTVASIYRLAYVEELIPTNPCARIPRPKVHRDLQRREVLTVLEYAVYLTAARALGPTHHAIAVLGGMLGLRASEMAGLTVESLTSVRGYTTLTFIGKGDKPARMPVPLPALPAVQAAVADRTSGSLLQTRTGAALDRRAVYRYVNATARAAGIARPIGPTRCAARSARSDSTRAALCATSSTCSGTAARRPRWPATTSTATPSSGTLPTRSPGSSLAGPAEAARTARLQERASISPELRMV
jgi:integrase/recombinase XerC/integrase/recombinase XerD